MKLVENLSAWFADLQPRERLIISLGGAVLIVAAIYMALLPAMEKNAELESRYQTLADDMQWLREQSQVVSRLKNSCSGQALQSGKPKDIISRTARRNQMKVLGMLQDDPATYSLTVSGSTPNRILLLVHQLGCQGLALETLSITPADDEKLGYIADIEVGYVD